MKTFKKPKTLYNFLPTILARRFEEFENNRQAAGETELREGRDMSFIKVGSITRSGPRSPKAKKFKLLREDSLFMKARSLFMNSAKAGASEAPVEYGEVTSAKDVSSEDNSDTNSSEESSLGGKCTKCKYVFRSSRARFCQMCGARRGIVLS